MDGSLLEVELLKKSEARFLVLRWVDEGTDVLLDEFGKRTGGNADVVATERVVDGCVEDVLTEREEREESGEVGSGGILDGSCDGGGAMCGMYVCMYVYLNKWMYVCMYVVCMYYVNVILKQQMDTL